MALIGVLSFHWPMVSASLLIVIPVFALGVRDCLQKQKAILRNFPILGNFRYWLEMVRPEIRQYFMESETDGTPFQRNLRSVVYQRAKLETETVPFGTQKDVYQIGYEWLGHSLTPTQIDATKIRVTIGGPQCKHPYSASLFNISALSYGALSWAAIQALNGGARLGGFYHNTGEGGVSTHHLSEGANIVWQIGTGYFGCRTPDGKFSPEIFRAGAAHDSIKMIEIKLSQGAKPSHGGILPAAKITKEISELRKIPLGVDVISPAAHSTFSTPKELLKFIGELRELSLGKPIGIKLCIGQPHEFVAICKAILELGIIPDFMTIDGGEGGTGAAPMEFSDSVGMPLEDGLAFAHDTLVIFDLRKHIRLIASGKIISGFHIFSRLALGADICNSARGMMMALGCIQARQCNTNKCPTGVATTDEDLIYGLVPSSKKIRVYNYHRNTLKSFSDLLSAAGLTRPSQITRHHVHRRVGIDTVKTYAELFPYPERNSFAERIPSKYRGPFELAQTASFSKDPTTQIRKVA